MHELGNSIEFSHGEESSRNVGSVDGEFRDTRIGIFPCPFQGSFRSKMGQGRALAV